VGHARTLGAPSHTRTELNTLYTANDLGDSRIMSLRTDEEQAVACQLANLNYRMMHGGCLAQAGVIGGIIQQMRLAEGLTASPIVVCMKVGAAVFSDTFCDRFPPTCSAFSNARI
jgi:hypothetical protein